MAATAEWLPRLGAGPRLAVGARLRSLVRGRPADPRWVRPALLAVLAVAAWVQPHGKAVSGLGLSSGTLYEVSAS